VLRGERLTPVGVTAPEGWPDFPPDYPSTYNDCHPALMMPKLAWTTWTRPPRWARGEDAAVLDSCRDPYGLLRWEEVPGRLCLHFCDALEGIFDLVQIVRVPSRYYVIADLEGVGPGPHKRRIHAFVASIGGGNGRSERTCDERHTSRLHC
jgi:hypothetical protein